MIDVEGIDIGHAADVVDDGHEAHLQVGVVNMVLAGHTTNELLRIVAVGVHDGLNHLLHECLHNLITRQLHIEYRTTAVDVLHGKLRATTIGLTLQRTDMVYEAARKGACQYLVLMFYEGVDTFILQFTDDTGTQIDYLLVFVGELLTLYTLHDMLLGLLVEEVEHQALRLFKGDNLQLMGILQVHYLIADIVSSFHEIHQRMAHIAQGLARLGNTNNAHFIGNTLVGILLALEETELSLLAGSRRGKGILHNAGNGGVAHHETARATTFELVGQQTEGIGITLEMSNVIPEGWRHLLTKCTTRSLGQEGLDGLLTRMPKGWITQVVGQTGGGHYLTYLLKQRTTQFGMALLDEALSHIVAQRHTYAGHLKGMSQTVVHKDASRQGEHLRLVLQAAKRCREDETVVVTLEFRTVIMALRMALFLTESLV